MSTTALDGLLAAAARYEASDVHLTADAAPLMRADGDLVADPGLHRARSRRCGSSPRPSASWRPAQRDEFEERHEVDLAHASDELGRFRVNVFRQLGSIAVALRFIPERVFTLEELGAPAIACNLALKPRGLVLLTGPTGSGKSTTLTAMVDIINNTLPAHVITIEDPIEFHHESKRALIHQREIGADTASFAEALRRVLRQDPDVILIGELRDPESIRAALSAAETGHLVLSTLHTQGAAKSINRIVDVFPQRSAASDPHAARRHAAGHHQPDAAAARRRRTGARSRPRCSSTRPPSRTSSARGRSHSSTRRCRRVPRSACTRSTRTSGGSSKRASSRSRSRASSPSTRSISTACTCVRATSTPRRGRCTRREHMIQGI